MGIYQSGAPKNRARNQLAIRFAAFDHNDQKLFCSIEIILFRSSGREAAVGL